jgi:gliding motility-associated-like protein
VVSNETVPVISNCPGNIQVRAESGSTSVTWVEPTATVACGVVTLEATHRPGDIFPVGETVVTYTASTQHGETAECKFKVTVSVEIEFSINQVVTPNGDEVNDYWELKGIENFDNNKVVVVDRWGNVVYKASNYDNDRVAWRGENQQGNAVPTGTYFYTISVEFHSDRVEKKGFVELVR